MVTRKWLVGSLQAAAELNSIDAERRKDDVVGTMKTANRERTRPGRCAPEIDRLYYYGLGTRFGTSRPFDHARSIAFCTFLRHFLGSSMALNDCFFFQLA